MSPHATRAFRLPVLLGVGLCLGLIVIVAGQTPSTSSQTPPDLAAYRDAMKIADPAARLKALDKIFADFPDSTRLADFYTQKLSTLFAITPVDLAEVDAVIAKTRAARTPRTPHEVLNLIAMTLMPFPEGQSRAEALSREAIVVLGDEETYAKAWQKRYTKNPNDPKELETQLKEGRQRYAGDLARYTLYLGRILNLEQRPGEAKVQFEKALAVSPLLGQAAMELASLAESAGDWPEAYKQLSWGAITGRIGAKDRPRLETAYAKTHPDTPNGLESDLDRLFRESFKNPIVAARYTPSAQRSTRTVLAEMFTGAGCVPCLSVDLSFETMLERYSRDELVVLMYHIHAPTADPLSNRSVQVREKTYNVNGAPTTFIDGVRDSSEGPREEALDTFRQLDAKVARELEAEPSASLQIDATINNGIVTARAFASGTPASATDLRLQVALVERLVRYSGENGQRFHPMVVRALGGPNATGFPIAAGKDEVTVSHTFDIDALSTDNLVYYDEYAADLKARTGLVTTFLEKKNVIDPQNLAVVAFIEDASSHRVLQAAFATPVEAAPEPVKWSAAVAGSGRVSVGNQASVQLTARLEPGWHLYALTPAKGGPPPTSIALAAGQPFVMAGIIDSPAPRTAYDPNFDTDVSFFEDDVTFSVPVKATTAAKPGAQSIAVSVAFQVCDAHICLPPKRVTVTAPIVLF